MSQVVSNCCTNLPRRDVGKRGQNFTLTCQQIKISFVTGQTAKQKYSPSHEKQIVALGHKLLYKLKELRQFYSKPPTSQQHNHIRTTNSTERENSFCRRSVGIVPILEICQLTILRLKHVSYIYCM